jgi:hypothetical protein
MSERTEISTKLRRRDLRAFACVVLEQAGYDVKPKLGPRIVPGAQLFAVKGTQTITVAVRTSLSRAIRLNRDAAGRWRTIGEVDEVMALVPAQDDPSRVEALRINANALKEVFDAEVAAQQSRGLNPPLDAPISVSMDEKRPPGSGAAFPGLKARAKWSQEFPLSQVVAETPELNRQAGFVARVKREFAALIGVDEGKVVVELRVVA